LKQQVRETVLGKRLAETGMFAPKRLRRLVDEHQGNVHDHAPVLWALLMFDGFLRQVEGCVPAPEAKQPLPAVAI
jgi:asparagine synthase (glutamine-hydrolysing)